MLLSNKCNVATEINNFIIYSLFICNSLENLDIRLQPTGIGWISVYEKKYIASAVGIGLVEDFYTVVFVKLKH